jgi:DNA polymerase-1
MSTTQKPLILIDGSSYLFRAFHALPPLTNSKGEPTGAMYGVINMIRKLIKDYAPEKIAVVFDPKGKTFREDLYPAYKANRPAMPEELAQQIPPLFDIIKAMGLPLIIVDGVEADDVIGTLAKQAEQQHLSTLISTGDKDMAQLVNAHTTCINTMTGKTLDSSAVKEKFGVTPEQIIDYLSLIGDSVDNIPGVPKVGPKTAAKWLAEYTTLENIMQHAEAFKGKIGEYLRDSLAQLPLSKDLATIRTEIDLPVTIDQLTPQPAHTDKLIEYFTHYEFKSWLAELLENTQPAENTRKDYTTILDADTFAQWLDKLKASQLFAFDTETTSLDYMQAEIVGVSFAVTSGEAAYLPLAHDYPDVPKQLSRKQVLQQLKPLLEDPAIKKVGQNLKYDMSVLARYAIRLRGIAFDTMLESYVLNSTSNRHDMNTLALKYLGTNTIHYEDICGKGAKQICFSQVEIDTASQYAAEDADITLQLHETLWPKLQNTAQLQKVFTDIELPLVSVLSDIERHGVLIDAVRLTEQSEYLAKRIAKLEAEAYQIAGEVFNLGSPKQLQGILFDKLGLPVTQKTPSGQPSTGEAVLEELSHDYPLPKLILAYRQLSKLKSTYTDKLPQQIDANTQRVHTSYHQAVTSTGRLSSSDPNLQNIPIRTEEGRNIRKAFIAPPGYKLVAADYSQIELRIMAHLSDDPGLVQAFAQGLDIHRATAAEVYGVKVDQVSDEQRRHAKAINFGLIYGMSAFGLARQLGIERQLAQEYMDLYFARYPGVKTYMEQTRKQAHAQAYVETLAGRRLYLEEINSRNLQRQRAAERAAINAPMQGTAADIIKLAMIHIHTWLNQEKHDASIVMQVHDELVFEIQQDIVDSLLPKINQLMTQCFPLKVPLVVDIGVGNDWDEAH